VPQLEGELSSIDLIDAPMCGCMMPAMASSGQGSERLNTQLLVDSIPALIHTARPDGHLDYFNKRWLEYLGATLDEVAGWNWTNFIHPEDVEGILTKWRACLATGEVFEHETRVRSANGDYRWMFHRKVPLRDANGSIVKWYGSSLDIDERKTAEEALRNSQAYLAEAQNLSHTGSWANAATGEPRYWSEECYRVLGFDPAEPLPSLATIFQSLSASSDAGRGKSELRRAVCRITSGRGWPILARSLRKGGEFSTESATENIPPGRQRPGKGEKVR
jgi:PAS domain S-box-containing protein